ncbi:MAG: hypothetical protein ACFCU5_02825 [Pleurocapsa sp.]
MIEISHQDFAIAQTLSLIDSYAFDLQGRNADKLLQEWLNVYNSSWIRLATIEALYLGRYKIISIEHILNVWSRLGSPNSHFTHEFERLICRKLPRHLIDYSDFQLANMFSAQETTTLIPALDLEERYWSQIAIAKTPIDQFVPLPDVSSFFNKLKTFATENKTN